MAKQAGFDEYCVKPGDLKFLDQMINNRLCAWPRQRVVQFTAPLSADCLPTLASSYGRAFGTLEVARFLCGFELIAREHQKLLGVAISVIGLMLVDFSFSKKPVGFFSKPDVFSGIVAESFSQLAAHSHPFVLLYRDRAVDDIHVPRRIEEAQ